MLTMVSTIEEIKAWLREQVADIQLQRPGFRDTLDGYELVMPEIYSDLVPPGGVVPTNDRIRVPCLVVGLDEVRTDADETTYQVTLTAVIYDPGQQTKEGEHLQTELNFDGYLTLLNLLDHLRAALMREQVIGQTLKLEYPISVKTYEEQPWPYWYGYLRFALTGPAYPQTRYKL